jgi:hypothetical protein
VSIPVDDRTCEVQGCGNYGPHLLQRKDGSLSLRLCGICVEILQEISVERGEGRYQEIDCAKPPAAQA